MSDKMSIRDFIAPVFSRAEILRASGLQLSTFQNWYARGVAKPSAAGAELLRKPYSRWDGVRLALLRVMTDDLNVPIGLLEEEFENLLTGILGDFESEDERANLPMNHDLIIVRGGETGLAILGHFPPGTRPLNWYGGDAARTPPIMGWITIPLSAVIEDVLKNLSVRRIDADE